LIGTLPAKPPALSKSKKGVAPMNTVLNLLSAAAVVVTGTVASTAPTIESTAPQSAQVIIHTQPTLPTQLPANSAARTASFMPSVSDSSANSSADSLVDSQPLQFELDREANQRWVF
jgi:hypothetical protein